MYKVAVIGERQDILGFTALGFTVLEAADTDAARDALRLATSGADADGVADGGYAVIFITESYAAALAMKFQNLTIPLPRQFCRFPPPLPTAVSVCRRFTSG